MTELPKLPDQCLMHGSGPRFGATVRAYYTADQMRAYAEEAVKQERERCSACADDFAAMMENGAGELEPGGRLRQLARQIRDGDAPLGTAAIWARSVASRVEGAK